MDFSKVADKLTAEEENLGQQQERGYGLGGNQEVEFDQLAGQSSQIVVVGATKVTRTENDNKLGGE